ncbi:MAG: glutaminase domain-containing protein [bacterium]
MKYLLLALILATPLLNASTAIPLVVKDPNLNVWLMADHPCDDWARHWTGGIKAIAGMARIDGKPFKFFGLAGQYPEVEILPLKSSQVNPTQTKLIFERDAVRLELTFLTPALPDDLKLLSLPITYLILSVKSVDGKPHNVQLYFDISGEWASGEQNKEIVWNLEELKGGKLLCFRVKQVSQNILQEINDYADWGFPIWATGEASAWEAGADAAVRGKFLKGERLANDMDWNQPRKISDRWPVFAFLFDLGNVGTREETRKVIIGHIREETASFSNRLFLPLWRSYFRNWEEMLLFAWENFKNIKTACDSFDRNLIERARKAGGDDYANLLSLIHRQVLGACELAYSGNDRFMFMKEISSGSFIQTVDVVFPASPFFLATNPELLKMQLEPIFRASESEAWKEPFAPHDLGRYPVAGGQSYGAPMPIEESGNMLLMVLAYTNISKDLSLARAHFDILERWANYLSEKGLEPEEQLCTDDFTGPSALNVNLSAKAIGGVASFARLCKILGKNELSERYEGKAREMLDYWLKRAEASTHLSRIYGKNETWSLKYNLFYAKLAGLDLFPRQIVEREVDFYLSKLNKYGVPLDERFTYTKADWLSWVAFMSENKEKREKLLQALGLFVKETPDKVPFTDWYDTQTGKVVGFRARPVLGALYALLLL